MGRSLGSASGSGPQRSFPICATRTRPQKGYDACARPQKSYAAGACSKKSMRAAPGGASPPPTPVRLVLGDLHPRSCLRRRGFQPHPCLFCQPQGRSAASSSFISYACLEENLSTALSKERKRGGCIGGRSSSTQVGDRGCWGGRGPHRMPGVTHWGVGGWGVLSGSGLPVFSRIMFFHCIVNNISSLFFDFTVLNKSWFFSLLLEFKTYKAVMDRPKGM